MVAVTTARFGDKNQRDSMFFRRQKTIGVNNSHICKLFTLTRRYLFIVTKSGAAGICYATSAEIAGGSAFAKAAFGPKKFPGQSLVKTVINYDFCA